MKHFLLKILLILVLLSNISIVNAEEDKTIEFINEIKDYAMELSYENDLYASLMIAQAVLESGRGQSTLSKNDYNIFGIKGSYNGEYERYWTWEDDGKGNTYEIKAKFRKYPSFKESLEDYTLLLRNGLDFDHEFYSGTWKSRTEDNLDAAAFLQGRYATDTHYFEKLSGIIEDYNLGQYDVSLEDYYQINEIEANKSENDIKGTLLISNLNITNRYPKLMFNLFSQNKYKLLYQTQKGLSLDLDFKENNY